MTLLIMRAYAELAAVLTRLVRTHPSPQLEALLQRVDSANHHEQW